MTRWARRVDRNHAAIREGLRKLGYTVWDTSRLGGGFPDLLVWDKRRLILVEVKMPGERLTVDELAFHKLFPVAIVHTVEEDLDALS